MEEFVQKFKRAARGSEYEKKALMKKFKRRISEIVRRKLIKIERKH